MGKFALEQIQLIQTLQVNNLQPIKMKILKIILSCIKNGNFIQLKCSSCGNVGNIWRYLYLKYRLTL